MSKPCSEYLQQLIALLNDGQWHDGETIGASLGISRNAVWKMVKKLEKYGINIESVKARGYQLQEPLVLLQKDKIRQKLTMPVELEVFESVTSTNDCPQKRLSSNGLVCYLAEAQTRGRGRFARQWQSPFGRNLYFSCLYPFAKDVSELAGLSLVVALAMIKGLSTELGELALKAKWPNDLLFEGRKLAGSLIEVKAESHNQCQAIIGVGINVNAGLKDMNIDQPWVALSEITGGYIDRNQLAASIINQLIHYLQVFTSQGWQPFLQEWQQVDALLNQNVRLYVGDKVIEGVGQGVNEQGHLLVATPGEDLMAYSSGEVSFHQ